MKTHRLVALAGTLSLLALVAAATSPSAAAGEPGPKPGGVAVPLAPIKLAVPLVTVVKVAQVEAKPTYDGGPIKFVVGLRNDSGKTAHVKVRVSWGKTADDAPYSETWTDVPSKPNGPPHELLFGDSAGVYETCNTKHYFVALSGEGTNEVVRKAHGAAVDCTYDLKPAVDLSSQPPGFPSASAGKVQITSLTHKPTSVHAPWACGTTVYFQPTVVNQSGKLVKGVQVSGETPTKWFMLATPAQDLKVGESKMLSLAMPFNGRTGYFTFRLTDPGKTYEDVRSPAEAHAMLTASCKSLDFGLD